MKKLLYIVFALIFILVSCTGELDLHSTDSKDCITLNVFNSPMTKVSDAGLDYERHLTRLDVFFYVKGQRDQNCVYYQEVTDSKYLTGSAKIPFYVVEEQINAIFPNGNNTCDVLVIANLPAPLRTFDTNPEGGYADTQFNTLSSILLNINDGIYDGIDKDFIMAGMDGNVRKDNNNNASGTVKLLRASAKITVSVNIPEKIVLDDNVTMIPILEELDDDAQKRVSLKTAMHNAVSNGYVYPAGAAGSNATSLTPSYFHTDKVRYKFVMEIPAQSDEDVKKYQYTCEIPFYSYQSVWEKGDEHAAYFTLELPWKNQNEPTANTYFYQILINSGERRLDPNQWYDLTVNVGVIGSTVEAKPIVLNDMSFYILDWTEEPDPEDMGGGDRYEDLQIEQYTYFAVPQRRIEMNNTTTGIVNFEASHSVGWALEWPTDNNIQSTFDEMEMTYNSSLQNPFAAYYVKCSGSAPSAVDLSRFISVADLELATSGQSLTFNYPSAEIEAYNKTQTTANQYNIYSPVYVHLKLWLDIDGSGTINGDEANYVEYVTFVYYPAMYIVPDLSVQRSVYVNGYRSTNADHNVIEINGWDLGGAPGTDNNNPYMHVITVSSFAASNIFPANPPGITGNIKYIIGDPRQRECDTNLNDEGYIMSDYSEKDKGWAEGKDNQGKDIVGELDHYYPTAVDGEAYRIVSPKFRIASRYGGYSAGDSVGAAMRCASYQEDGYPAGRWRLPTTAEIMFVIELQSKSAIAALFNGTSYYFSATHRVQNNNGVKIDSQSGDNSVRCVYDEWYWGSNKDAAKNPSASAGAADEYLFTWADAEVWPCENNH